MLRFRFWEGAALSAGLVVTLLASCSAPLTPENDNGNVNGNDNDAVCSAPGDVCGPDSPCCESLACSNGLCVADDADDPVGPGAMALSDFVAEDVNLASSRYQQAVSPRDYLGQVSAWYFGHST